MRSKPNAIIRLLRLFIVAIIVLITSNSAAFDYFGVSNLSLIMSMGGSNSGWTPLSATTSGGVTAVHWYSPSHTNYQDSARTTAVTADGDVTGSATDQMVAADHVSQGTTANKPLYKVNISGGKPMWLFDGSNDAIFGAFTNGGTINQPLTIFGVIQLDATKVDDNIYAHWHDSGLVSGVDRTYFGKDMELTPDNFVITSPQLITGGPADVNYNIWGIVLDYLTSKFYINGVLKNTGDTGPRPLVGLGLGGQWEWKGYIGDVLIYPGALSAADLNQIGQYLATFYGLTWTAIP